MRKATRDDDATTTRLVLEDAVARLRWFTEPACDLRRMSNMQTFNRLAKMFSASAMCRNRADITHVVVRGLEAALPSRGAAQIKELLSDIAILDKGTLSRGQLLVDIMVCRYRPRGERMGPFTISWIILFPKCAEPVEIHIQT